MGSFCFGRWLLLQPSYFLTERVDGSAPVCYRAKISHSLGLSRENIPIFGALDGNIRRSAGQALGPLAMKTAIVGAQRGRLKQTVQM